MKTESPLYGHAHTPSDIPSVPHFAILTFCTDYTDGTERTPGFGTIGRFNYQIRYEWYLSRDKWEQEIASRTRQHGNANFVALSVAPSAVTTTITVAESKP